MNNISEANGFKIQWGNVITEATYPIRFTSRAIPLLRPFLTPNNSMMQIFVGESRLDGFIAKIKWHADDSVTSNTINVEWVAIGY